MTVQIKLNDGINTTTQTYRNIYKGVNLAETRENFYANEQYCKWGVMVQLKGNGRLVLGRFGTKDEEE